MLLNSIIFVFLLTKRYIKKTEPKKKKKHYFFVCKCTHLELV